MRLRTLAVSLLCLSALAFAACQSYDFVFQPNANRLAVHLSFQVQTPSKADILFVVDNSGSMASKQQNLANSITTLMDNLATEDAKYRIGIVSTDAYGFITDCDNVTNPPVASNSSSTAGAKGSYCTANAAAGLAQNCNTSDCWQLRRPHDGTLGRLVAGYDPNSFSPSNYIKCTDANFYTTANPNLPNRFDPNHAWNPNALENPNFAADTNCVTAHALSLLMPLGAYPNPNDANDISLYDNQGRGARYVINRDAIDHEACDACACNPSTCGQGQACYESCAKPTADIMVEAYFRANINALGQNGFGWEEGLKSSLWAVGIDPENANDATALNPAYNLTTPTGDPNIDPPNVYGGTDSPSSPTYGSWLRDDALLAIMYVSDEQDCSMPQSFIVDREEFEAYANPNQPTGSMCYQRVAQQAVLADGRYDPNRLARLLSASKQNSSEVAIGLIASVELDGPSNNLEADAVGRDCVYSNSSTPSTSCSGVAGSADNAWAQYTIDANNFVNPPSLQSTWGCSPAPDNPIGACPAGQLPYCDGQSGSIYVSFADNFLRRSFESICRNDPNSYGDEMASFSRIATQACFNLQNVAPYNNDPNYVVVERTPSGSSQPDVLSYQPVTSPSPGWYYDVVNNEICLTGLERLVGDEYDIFIQQDNTVSYQN